MCIVGAGIWDYTNLESATLINPFFEKNRDLTLSGIGHDPDTIISYLNALFAQPMSMSKGACIYGNVQI